MLSLTDVLAVKVQVALTTNPRAAGLDGCEMTDAARPLIGGAVDNFTNFFKTYAPGIGIVLIVIGGLMSMANKGAPWFMRALMVVGVLILLGGVSDTFEGMGSNPCPAP